MSLMDWGLLGGVTLPAAVIQSACGLGSTIRVILNRSSERSSPVASISVGGSRPAIVSELRADRGVRRNLFHPAHQPAQGRLFHIQAF